MLEAALLILLATGGLWALARRRRRQQQRIPIKNADFDQRASPIARGGLYQLSKPGEALTNMAFSDLRWIPGGLVWCDNQDGQPRMVEFGHVQWVSAVTLSEEKVAAIALHLEFNRHWHILTLQLPEADMTLLAQVLRRVIPVARRNIGNPPASPIGPIPARTVEETLQGETTLGAEVGLYLLPHLLVVLHDDRVQAKLDTSSIRRVLAVERISGKLDGLLQRGQSPGIVRLYSLHETAAFALPQYRELAEEISYLSRCPVEFIAQEDKLHKT